jgi:hypothetical protein
MTSFASYLPIHLPYLHFPHSHHSVIINIRQTCLPLPVYKILQCQLLAPTNLHLTLPRPELPRSLKCSNPLSAKPKREAITITISHPPVTIEEATAAVHAPHQRCSDSNLGGTAQRLQPRVSDSENHELKMTPSSCREPSSLSAIICPPRANLPSTSHRSCRHLVPRMLEAWCCARARYRTQVGARELSYLDISR